MYINILKRNTFIIVNIHFTFDSQKSLKHKLLLKVIEKCTNFYIGTEKLPP